jgi:predicted transcriptional regulator
MKTSPFEIERTKRDRSTCEDAMEGIRQGLEDAEHGRLVNAREFFKQMDAWLQQANPKPSSRLRPVK